MIKVIMDKKGTGKTKRLIDMANTSAREDKGDVVFIDNNNHHIYELSHQIRFVDTSEFEINDFYVFHGFVCGIISANFDVSEIYIDGIFEIIDDKMEFFEVFLSNIQKAAEKFNISFIMTITGDSKVAPEFIRQYM
ncbi:MAG: hypothetical protein AB7G87_06380 [Clostridia bacterium]